MQHWRRPAWALPIVLFLATFGTFGVRRPGSVRAMLTSAQGLATTGAALIVVAVFLFAATRRQAIMRVAPYVLSAGVLGAAAYAEVPFERSSTQNRALITGEVVDAAAPATTTTAGSGAPAPEASPMAPLASTTTTTTPAPRPAALRHSTGSLVGIDHSASGTVSIIEDTATGQLVVRFENFRVQFTPAPVLYVLEGENQRNPGGINLGPFTATDGTTLDVAVPPGPRPGPGWTVLIWCERFSTPIANATQRGA